MFSSSTSKVAKAMVDLKRAEADVQQFLKRMSRCASIVEEDLHAIQVAREKGEISRYQVNSAIKLEAECEAKLAALKRIIEVSKDAMMLTAAPSSAVETAGTSTSEDHTNKVNDDVLVATSKENVANNDVPAPAPAVVAPLSQAPTQPTPPLSATSAPTAETTAASNPTFKVTVAPLPTSTKRTAVAPGRAPAAAMPVSTAPASKAPSSKIAPKATATAPTIVPAPAMKRTTVASGRVPAKVTPASTAPALEEPATVTASEPTATATAPTGPTPPSTSRPYKMDQARLFQELKALGAKPLPEQALARLLADYVVPPAGCYFRKEHGEYRSLYVTILAFYIITAARNPNSSKPDTTAADVLKSEALKDVLDYVSTFTSPGLASEVGKGFHDVFSLQRCTIIAGLFRMRDTDRDGFLWSSQISGDLLQVTEAFANCVVNDPRIMRNSTKERQMDIKGFARFYVAWYMFCYAPTHEMRRQGALFFFPIFDKERRGYLNPDLLVKNFYTPTAAGVQNCKRIHHHVPKPRELLGAKEMAKYFVEAVRPAVKTNIVRSEIGKANNETVRALSAMASKIACAEFHNSMVFKYTSRYEWLVV